MIADDIIKLDKSMEERGIPAESWFEVEFADGSKRSEHDTSWAMMSEKREVGHFGSKKQVTACKFPVKRLSVFHEGLTASIEVPEGAVAYQAIRAEMLFLPEDKHQYRTMGRTIGYVVGNEIIEELYIDALQRQVFGMRK